MSRRLTFALPGVLALLLTACGTGTPFRSNAGQDAAPVVPSIEQTVTLAVGGRERSYLLQPAAGMTGEQRAALVVVLHQEGGTPRGIAIETALQALRRQGATLAFPAGVDRSWDAGKCCGVPMRQGVDDLAFLDAVLADAGRHTPIDSARSALVGYSSGGMLAYGYVCSRPGRLAVAVVVSGSLETECRDGISVPDVLALHGKKDGTIGFQRPIFVQRLGLAPRTATSTLGALTRSAGCRPPSTTHEATKEVRTWTGCRGGTVEAVLVPEVGHRWGTLDASRLTRQFLLAHLLENR